MRGIAILLIAGLVFAGSVWSSGNSLPAGDGMSRTPVVVELFTSEGCSSCPPADLLLQKFDAQPIAGAELIVLSEHVDYWNHLGWADPYSSAAYSDRQSAYGKKLQLESVYTPQMIVDGGEEFVGSDASQAKNALQKAAAASGKIPVRVSDVWIENGAVKAHVEASPLPASTGKADVVFMIALNHAESQVARGENSGRRLTHVAVVRSLSKAGSLQSGQGFSQDVTVKFDKGADPAQLRVIAFVQESGQGKILGAAMEKVSR
jgi:hypothetical protein